MQIATMATAPKMIRFTGETLSERMEAVDRTKGPGCFRHLGPPRLELEPAADAGPLARCAALATSEREATIQAKRRLVGRRRGRVLRENGHARRLDLQLGASGAGRSRILVTHTDDRADAAAGRDALRSGLQLPDADVALDLEGIGRRRDCDHEGRERYKTMHGLSPNKTGGIAGPSGGRWRVPPLARRPPPGGLQRP